MATTTINLPQLKSVTYTSPSQGLNAAEPMIVEFGDAAVWAKPFTLSVPALPTGVASFTVTRTSTKTSYAATGAIVSGGGNAQTVPVYYGDTLTVSATAAESYGDPTATLSQDTVTGDVTLTVTAGAYTPSWHTIIDGSGVTLRRNNTTSISGVKAGVPTRASFSGHIYTNYSTISAAINQRTEEESDDGVYTGSGRGTISSAGGGSWSYGFTLKMQNGSVYFTTSVDGYFYDDCGSTEYDVTASSNGYVTITFIEQYY